MLTRAKFIQSLLRTNLPSSTSKTLTTTTTTTRATRDEYFAAIHHVSNIVRRDFYLERTLNKLRITVTNELVFRVLRACSNSPTESLRFFNWARSHHPSYNPTSLEFEQIIKTLADSNNYQSMWNIIHQMKKNHNLSLSPETVSSVIESYGKHRHVDQAVEVFNKASLFNCSQNDVVLYNSLLFALCESNLFHGAYALIRRMVRKGVSPDKRTYSILVNAWCSNGKMREAQQFLKEMSDQGFNPPVRGRDILIEGLLNAGFYESAKEMVRKMMKEGFVPDVGTFNALVEVLCKCGEVEFCIGLYHEVCKLGLVPDVNTYKILVPAVSKAGLMDEAFRLLHNSAEEGHRPFPSLYAPIIKALCRRGQFDDAFCFFSDMKVKGHPPNRPVYTMLITMCGRGGRFVDAANYLMEMTEIGLMPMSRCFDMVTDGLKNCGKHDLAKRIEQLEVSVRGSFLFVKSCISFHLNFGARSLHFSELPSSNALDCCIFPGMMSTIMLTEAELQMKTQFLHRRCCFILSVLCWKHCLDRQLWCMSLEIHNMWKVSLSLLIEKCFCFPLVLLYRLNFSRLSEILFAKSSEISTGCRDHRRLYMLVPELPVSKFLLCFSL